MTYAVCALYRFVRLDDYEQLREPLRQFLLDHEIRGTLLLAREGINGTVAGPMKASPRSRHAWPRIPVSMASITRTPRRTSCRSTAPR